MPLIRRAVTVKLAVHSINWGMRNSPNGTEKNKKPKGNKRSRVTSTPMTAGTAATSMPMNANWVMAFTEANSPTSHTRAKQATTPPIQSTGCGDNFESATRFVQTSQTARGGTKNAWVNVPDLDQMLTMPSAVLRYKNRVHTNRRMNATSTFFHGCVTSVRTPKT